MPKNYEEIRDEHSALINLLFTPSYISRVLSRNGLTLKKSFGQNFLISRSVAEKVLGSAGLASDDRVLEIGPGLGTLTFMMAPIVEHVIAVEIDGGISRVLSRFIEESGTGNITVINADFLRSGHREALERRPTKAVSNFPYSSGIRSIAVLLERFPGIDSITGTVQRELALRITAAPGDRDYAAISAYLQFLAHIDIINRSIGPGCFFPAPGVESSIISIQRKKDPPVDAVLFKKVVQASFRSRRQTLVNNLMALEGPLKKDIEELVFGLFGDRRIRAEAVSVQGFVELSSGFQRLIP